MNWPFSIGADMKPNDLGGKLFNPMTLCHIHIAVARLRIPRLSPCTWCSSPMIIYCIDSASFSPFRLLIIILLHLFVGAKFE